MRGIEITKIYKKINKQRTNEVNYKIARIR